MKKIFYIDFDDNDALEGINAISLVEKAAVEFDFLKFAEEKKVDYYAFDEDKHIITGVALRADYPIYRYSEEKGDYYIVFEKETIKRIIQKFFKDGLINKVNLQHDDNAFVEGVYVIESYIIDRDKGINPIQFSSVENGSWIISYKVENQALWDEIKTSGKLNGFSIQGMFYQLAQQENLKDENDFEGWINNLIK